MLTALPGFESLPEWLQLAPGILFDLALKGLLVTGVLFLISPLLRRFSAATRSFVWAVGLAAVVVLPIVSHFAPAKHIEVFPVVVDTVERVQMPQPEQALLSGGDGSWAVSGVEGEPWAAPEADVAAVGEPAARPVPDPMMGAAAFLWEKARGLSLMEWILLIWTVGFGIVLIKYLVGTAQAWRLVRQAQPVVDPEWLGLAEGIRVGNRMRRPVRLIRSSRALMPLTWGIFYPVVLLSGDADEWSPERRRVVLMHEYAHVVRLDCLTQVVAQLACALHWFNPLVWWTARRLAADREQSCDDHVLVGARTTASDYARHLLEIACTLPTSYASPLAGVAMARPSSLEERIRAILDPERRRRLLNRSTAALVILLASIVLLPVAIVRTWGFAERAPEPAPVAVAQIPDVQIVVPDIQIDFEKMNEDLARMQAELQKMNFDFKYEYNFERLHDLEQGLQGKPWSAGRGVSVWSEKHSVSPGGRLEVNVPSANLRIEPGANDEAVFEVYVTDLELEAAKEYFSKLNFRIEKNGNKLSIRSNPQAADAWYEGQHVGLEVVARLPQTFDLNLKTADGNINLGSFFGRMDIRTADGNINTGALDGPSIVIHTSDGNVNTTRLSSPTVDVHTSDGNINLAAITGENLRIESADGNVNVGSADGNVKASLSDGNINFGRLSGNSVKLETGDGNITTGSIEVRNASIHTAGGVINVGRAVGGLNVETADGDINVVLASPGESSIRSAEGNIHVNILPGASLKLTAQGSKVHTGPGLSFKGSRDEQNLKGEVNGGGPTVQLFTAEGNIFVN